LSKADPSLPPSLLQIFIQTAINEVGSSELDQIVGDPTLLDAGQISTMNELEAGKTYAAIQSQLRTYYGRGARGTLLRIGQSLWEPMLHDRNLADRILAAGIKALPAGSRPKPALDLLAKFLRGDEGSVSVHSMDLNLLFVDSSSPTTAGLSESQPVCHVTRGLIRGVLFWATGKNFDVDETGCRAMGNSSCEFQVMLSGN
jgi:predicted hydrocarbon binding protein